MKTIALTTMALLIACSTDAPPPVGAIDAGALSDAEAGIAPDAVSDVTLDTAAPPTHPASSLAFHDHNLSAKMVDGIAMIGKAANESDVKTYNLYWATFALKKIALIGTIPKTGSDLTFPIKDTVPTGAGGLLVLTANDVGEMTTGVGVVDIDAAPSHLDISAGQPADCGITPSPVLDTNNQMLLVATQNGANLNKPGLFLCNGFGVCTYRDISAGAPAESGHTPWAVIDTTNKKLLVVTNDFATGHKLSLFRCDLDGTSCTYSDISAGQPGNSADDPFALVDVTNGKLLVIAQNTASANIAGLTRCNLDGTGCAYIDVSAGQGSDSGNQPTAIIDTINQKLLVVTNHFKDSGPGLFRCNLDGSACVHTAITGGQTSFTPRVVIEPVSQKLLVVGTVYNNSFSVGLYNCNLDGTGCIFGGISQSNVLAGDAVIDPINKQLLVAAIDTSKLKAGKPQLIVADFNAANSVGYDMSVSQGAKSGVTPRAVYDAANQRVMIVTDDGSNGYRPALYFVGL